MTYYVYIKTFKNIEKRQEQDRLISDYLNNKQLTVQKEFRSHEDIKNTNTKKKYINQIVIEELKAEEHLIIAGLEMLGFGSFDILETISLIMQKNIILHLVNENIILKKDDEHILRILESLLNIEKLRKKMIIGKSKTTLKKHAKKVGRTSKSMFDSYKKQILKLVQQKVPITKVLEKIQEDNSKLSKPSTKIKQCTSQALYNYVKKFSKLEKTPKTYIENPSSIKNSGFDLGVSVMMGDGTLSNPVKMKEHASNESQIVKEDPSNGKDNNQSRIRHNKNQQYGKIHKKKKK